MAPPPVTNHDVEVLDRLAAIRLIADEYLQGHWIPTKGGISNIAGIATWAARHAWAADFERELAA
jgi:hypothetical protein